MALAIVVMLSLALLWKLVSLGIYYGFYLLQWLTIIPQNLILKMDAAKAYSDIVCISFLAATVVMIVLHRFEIINLELLLPRSENRRENG